MPKIIEPTTDRYSSEDCDIAFNCGKYFVETDKTHLETPFIYLPVMDSNPWACLESLQIEHEDFKKSCEYTDPYTKYRNYAALPVAVLSNDTEKYKPTKFQERKSIAWDWEWNRHYNGENLFKCSEISKLFMGSGYSDWCCAYDGSSTRFKVRVPLDNGDHVLCHAWKWHGK